MTQKSPLLLCILDGVGLQESTYGNAVKQAHMPNFNQLLTTCPHSTLSTHGSSVGLPDGQMGNSEVGHLTLGSGRVIPQMLERIHHDINSGNFTHKPEWRALLPQLSQARAVHVFGLVSDGGVHSHSDHILGLCRALNPLKKDVFVHAITDGRDTAPQAGAAQLAAFEEHLAILEYVHLSDVIGRFYAMDRDQRWERTGAAWALYTQRNGAAAADAQTALQQWYTEGGDEFLPATTLPLPKTLDARLQAGDAVILANFRADRMRQLARCLLGKAADVTPSPPELAALATLTAYDTSYGDAVQVLYPPTTPANTLGEVVAAHGLHQLRIAETEKYPHVTFFLNGGREEPFAGEDRLLIPSPKVKTYDLQPQMSLPELTARLLPVMGKYDLIVLNIANGDMVGHCGDLQAAISACEAIDTALGQLLNRLDVLGGELLLLADHGNCETMLTPEGTPHTAHTLNPVPMVYRGNKTTALHSGTLADVAPTVLRLLNLPQPAEMSGTCLF